MSKKLTTIEFIKRANKTHRNKFDYSLAEYSNSKTKINIICSIHGVFSQVAAMHISGQGCPRCDGKGKTTEDIVQEFVDTHGEKYDYSKVIYQGSSIKVKIICSKHGIFEQTSNDHLRGHGCNTCGKSERLTTDIFINKAELIHDYKFDYSLVDYKNTNTKVKIICPVHGEFEQIAKVHLNGFGCKNCNESRGEKTINTFLENNNIKTLRQYVFKDCRHKLPLPFDFYLPDLNICIEFQGIQHYQAVEMFGGAQGFIGCQIRDKIKQEYCLKNNINLFFIKYNDEIEKILNNYFIGLQSNSLSK